MPPTYEVNFDGIVGPTHNFAGLSAGNVASTIHGGAISNPREAALQGLAKMKALADLGLRQAVLPPHDRPAVAILRSRGFTGTDAEVLRQASADSPRLLAACSSASAMWVANAATVSPSSDTADGRVHLTPANLLAHVHRSIEPPQTRQTLKAIFRDESLFAVHNPVEGDPPLGDEGAANHTRLAPTHGDSGLHLFVYGHRVLREKPGIPRPSRYLARQSLEASARISRRHGLRTSTVLFARQHPDAIDAGVFHNDVISVGNENVFLYHEQAFLGTERVVAELRDRWCAINGSKEFFAIPVSEAEVPVLDAVRSYLFNSQIVTTGPGRMTLVAPADCEGLPRVRAFIDRLVTSGRTPIQDVCYLDLRQSMRNGGGPACLRLRVVLNDRELASLSPQVILTDSLYATLVAWVRSHYRETLAPGDLGDPSLLDESRRALDQLTRLLGLGSIYLFQRG